VKSKPAPRNSPPRKLATSVRPARLPSPPPGATAAAVWAPAGPRRVASRVSRASHGRCCRSSRECRRRGRGCRLARRACVMFLAPASQSASAESRTSTGESPPRQLAAARALRPSAPPGLGPSVSPTAAVVHLPSECIGASPPRVDTCPRAPGRMSPECQEAASLPVCRASGCGPVAPAAIPTRVSLNCSRCAGHMGGRVRRFADLAPALGFLHTHLKRRSRSPA
jgi:hypothetical protein